MKGGDLTETHSYRYRRFKNTLAKAKQLVHLWSGAEWCDFVACTEKVRIF